MNSKIFKNSFLKIYLIRILVINFFSFFYLIDTISLDSGFISLQSFIYSLHIYLLYLFIIIETLSAFLGYYGYDFFFLSLILNNLDNLNYTFIKFIFFKNINFFYYLIACILTLIFLEKNKYFLQTKKKLINNRYILIIAVFIFILSNFNPNITHIYLMERLGFETFERLDPEITKVRIPSNRDVIKKNNFFRNDNWFNVSKASYIYKNQKRIADRQEINIATLLKNKNYNNIYIIINESYPNFKNEILRKNLFDKIAKNKDDIIIKKYKKKFYRGNNTQVAELSFFCGNKKVDFNEFLKSKLKTFVNKNKCWINNFKDKEMIYIHTFRESFFNRQRYRSFFDQSYFRKELKNIGLKSCEQKFSGICDYDVLNNMDKIVKNKNDKFLIFLTLNNHVPTEEIVPKKNNYSYCLENYPLNIHKQFCNLYHNQILFNKTLSNFISKMEKNDFLIFFADTPPKFPYKLMIHFEEDLEVFTFSKR